MRIEEMIDYWQKSADQDTLTAESLFKAKRYLPCLFYCHLFVEKILKALIVRETQKSAPYGHKLSRLAEFVAIYFSETQLKLLDDLTAFNIKTRYEDYKFALYKKATKDYTKKYHQRAKELYLCIKKNI